MKKYEGNNYEQILRKYEGEMKKNVKEFSNVTSSGVSGVLMTPGVQGWKIFQDLRTFSRM